MKIFVCEYVTGGGLYPRPLPASLVQEGTLMRDAVLNDLNALLEVRTFCTHDPRLPVPDSAQASAAIEDGEDVWEQWSRHIAESDAVLPIAPETDGALLRLTKLVDSQHKILLGCGAAGVEIASSKYRTFIALQAAGIDTAPTFNLDEFPVEQYDECVVKPDDGAGCEGGILFRRRRDFLAWRDAFRGPKFVVQPYVPGIPASLTMLCKQGRAWLLSCNIQKIKQLPDGFIYQGSVLNGVAQHWHALEDLANRIAAAIPTLSGYVGVDVILRGARATVLEINPRLTTSYAGLHRALAYNPARLLADLLYNPAFSSSGFSMPANIKHNLVEINVHG